MMSHALYYYTAYQAYVFQGRSMNSGIEYSTVPPVASRVISVCIRAI